MRTDKQDLFAALVRNPPKTVPEFSSEATAIEKTLEMRTRQYDRQVIMPKYEVQALGTDDMREAIRAVVREELQRLFPMSQPQVALIAHVVREVQRSLRVPDEQLAGVA